MMTKNLLRHFTSSSSSLNPFSETKYFSLRNGNLGAISSYFFSTRTATTELYEPSTPSPSSAAYSVPQDTLFKRLMGATNPRFPTAKEPISQILKQWVDEGREVDIYDVRNSIKTFRKLRRYNYALEISKWIGGIVDSNLTCGDAAVHLDLIYRVHGLVEAERYFESLPEDSKSFQTYGSLMNCYVQERLMDKAEGIMHKMRELGYGRTLSYNVMLNLYSQMGKRIKMKSLVQEMENRGISFDKFSYNILLTAYASASEIMEMEKLLMKIEADPFVVIDWMPYSIAATGYLKAGDIAKAEIMLKKFEEIIKKGPKARDKAVQAYQFLLTHYASMGRKDELYRIWKLQNKPQKLLNRSYTCMISSLLKLDDVDGALKMLDEWYAKQLTFDIRIPNLLIAAFCKKGQVQNAKLIISSLVEKGQEPAASTWSYMASGYCNNNQMEEAVEMMKKSLRKNPRWRPDLPVLASCLEYLKEKGDVVEAEEILGLLKEGSKLPASFRDRISRYIRKGDPVKQESDSSGEEEILDSTPS